ncbi:hypothetical protein [Confluentibacter citreus]|uniref:hypothetical protein n=1 Tax=Confluentibacter citreus TaxID=2007307 RepID=UPI0012FE67E2|nr:hypothetical protein [Confluentibacter citreus]
MAPSVIIAIDDSIDTSIFYSIAEEEDNGKSKNLISPFSLMSNELNNHYYLNDYKSFTYQFKNYPKPHPSLISPPPKQDIL